MANRQKLTDDLVASFRATGALYRVWDSIDEHLHIRVSPAGAKAWYRKVGKVATPLGSWPSVGVSEARKAQSKGVVSLGVSLASLAVDFEAGHIDKLADGTAVGYRRWLAAWVGILGDRPLSRITRADINLALPRLAPHAGARSRNYALAVLSKLFSWAMDRDLVDSNPCLRIPREEESKRDRYLSDTQLRELWSFCETEPHWGRVIQFLVSSGLRLGEALAIRADSVDLKTGLVHLGQTKTGPRSVTLGPLPLAILRAILELGGMPARNGLMVWWQRLRKRKPLPFTAASWLRIHDLRHSAASQWVQAGIPLASIGQLLGHAPGSKMTARYAHLGSMAESSQKASDAIGKAIKLPKSR